MSAAATEAATSLVSLTEHAHAVCPTGPISSWCCARRAAQTEATKPPPIGQILRLAKQSAETPPNVLVVLVGECLGRNRVDHSQVVVRTRAGTEEKQQPRRLQVLNRRNTLKQDSVGCCL